MPNKLSKEHANILENYDHVIVFPKVSAIRDTFTDIDTWLLNFKRLLQTAFNITEDHIKVHLDLGFEPAVLIGVQLSSSWVHGLVATSTESPSDSATTDSKRQISSVLVLRGPLCTDEKEATEFREFWSPLAEMRHVNAELRECVVWNTEHNVAQQVVDFLLQKKCGMTSRGGWYQVCSQLQYLVDSEETIRQSRHTMRTLTEDVQRHLLDLNPLLPQEIKAVHFDSELLRGTQPPRECMTLRQQNYKTAPHVVDTYLELEHSGKWPREWRAFHSLKQLYLLKVYELLRDQHPNLRRHLPASCRTLAEEGYLDLPWRHVVVRVRLLLPQEERLWAATPSEVRESQGVYKPLAKPPSGLPSSRVYAPLCQLVKRWMASPQLCAPVSAFLDCPVDLERLVAVAVFKKPEQESPDEDGQSGPGSLVAAFLRFLRFISKKKWKHGVEFSGLVAERDLVSLSESARRTYKLLIHWLLHWKKGNSAKVFFGDVNPLHSLESQT